MNKICRRRRIVGPSAGCTKGPIFRAVEKSCNSDVSALGTSIARAHACGGVSRWSRSSRDQQLGRWAAHNPKVAGSNPAPAMQKGPQMRAFLASWGSSSRWWAFVGTTCRHHIGLSLRPSIDSRARPVLQGSGADDGPVSCPTDRCGFDPARRGPAPVGYGREPLRRRVVPVVGGARPVARRRERHRPRD